MKPEDPDPLDDLLAQWQLQDEPPPDFRREVWRRIALETREPKWIERVAWWLLRPKREVLVLATAVIFAVAWGITHPPGYELTPQDVYVMSISPFDQNHLGGSLP